MTVNRAARVGRKWWASTGRPASARH